MSKLQSCMSLAAVLVIIQFAAADVVNIGASKDNTLYQDPTGSLSNGAGDYVFSGTIATGDRRRAVIAFDVAGSVPAGATIESVNLTLYMSRTIAGFEIVSLHVLWADWGEGTSDAAGQEGAGAASTLGDATWIHTTFDNDFWSKSGGDYNPTSSADKDIGNEAFYTWGSTAQLVADVQSWLDDPSSNFGWILIGNEATTITAKRFNSRENSKVSQRPVLTVEYTPPPVTGACCRVTGVCEITTQADCVGPCDTYQGDGTDCNPLLQCFVQASAPCCLPDGSCTVINPCLCTEQGGESQSPFVTCATADCPQPTGACCRVTGVCEITTQADCSGPCDTYRGDGTDCQLSCAVQAPAPCCLPDGSCTVVNPCLCTQQGGDPQSPFMTCETANCPQPTGACCRVTGVCEITTQADCSGPCDTYHGDGTNCQQFCAVQSPAPCCLPDGSCTVMNPCLCTQQGGDPQSPFMTCETADCPPPTGRCCRVTGECEVTTEADCSGPCDTYHGDGTDCNPLLQCFIQAPAPCCLPDGSCMVMNPCLCTEQGGESQSPFMTCETADCPPPTGACCRVTGICEITIQADCSGPCDVYQGDGSDCPPLLQCAIEAPTPCCLPDGSCVVMNPCLCRQQGGVSQSPFASCATVDCPQLTTLELAGNPLVAYPHFEFVRAFNFNRAVYLTIDPTLYPTVVGRTCDVYVVAARTEAEWDNDASLIDVRMSGPQTITFDGATIQGNEVLIINAGEFTGDAGTDIGVGYDVVIDCDQNGRLTGADFIDGRGDEAGLYIVHDLTQLGPLTTTFVDYTVACIDAPGHGAQRTWYPVEIATMGQLPLVVISHGNGQRHTWYDYLQEHLASYGYIVMSHRTNSVAGPSDAGRTTIEHTNAIIDQQSDIAGGVLNGHIDSSRIVWIGHGRGGEGVARAYNELVSFALDCDSNNVLHYDQSDVVLISNIAPTDNDLGSVGMPDLANPSDVTYHLLYGAADGIVNGCAAYDDIQPFNLYERGTGPHQATYVHGAGHNDFNCCGFTDADGPDLLGRSAVHELAKGIYLPLLKHYVEGNIPSKDFLWRQYESLRPVGSPAMAVVDRLYRDGDAAGNFMIEDYQTQPRADISSSGGAVTFDVNNLGENVMTDSDGQFTWNDPECEILLGDFNDDGIVGSEDWDGFNACLMGPGVPVPPECFAGDFDGDGDVDLQDFASFQAAFGDTIACNMNGMTMAGALDDSTGAVFGWSPGTDHFYEFEIIASERDFSDNAYLSFRACQITQHPETIAGLGDLTFGVTLRDGAGAASTINFGQYGGGIEKPYQRIGTNFSNCGPNPGWANEFEVVRIRLTDFTHNASGLDLTDIEAVGFEFGATFGSTGGRICLDEIQVTTD